MRKWFYAGLVLIFAAEILGGYLWPPLLWSLTVVVPLAAVGVFDVAQTRHTILRNFPLIGHGGLLPARKVTAEIARIRHVPVGQTVISPPRHSAFRSPAGLLEFAARLRESAGGKPVGIKVCLGTRLEFLAVCRAMIETGILLDFVTVDGGEGGTGAAPLEFSNSVGMPAREAWALVHNALTGAGLRDEVKVLASGKILTGFDMVRAFATGADACNSARGFMLALGCIQALRCNTDRCPTGVATQNPWLFRGLVVEDKAGGVARYHRATLDSLRDLLVAMGCSNPAQISPDRVFGRISPIDVAGYAELYERLTPGSLVDRSAPQAWLRDWDRASAERFVPASG